MGAATYLNLASFAVEPTPLWRFADHFGRRIRTIMQRPTHVEQSHLEQAQRDGRASQSDSRNAWALRELKDLYGEFAHVLFGVAEPSRDAVPIASLRFTQACMSTQTHMRWLSALTHICDVLYLHLITRNIDMCTCLLRVAGQRSQHQAVVPPNAASDS